MNNLQRERKEIPLAAHISSCSGQTLEKSDQTKARILVKFARLYILILTVNLFLSVVAYLLNDEE